MILMTFNSSKPITAFCVVNELLPLKQNWIICLTTLFPSCKCAYLCLIILMKGFNVNSFELKLIKRNHKTRCVEKFCFKAKNKHEKCLLHKFRAKIFQNPLSFWGEYFQWLPTWLPIYFQCSFDSTLNCARKYFSNIFMKNVCYKRVSQNHAAINLMLV